jgi:acetylornithine deacetylase
MSSKVIDNKASATVPATALAVLDEVDAMIRPFITEDAWMALSCELIKAGQPDAENPLDPDEPAGSEAGIAHAVSEHLKLMGMDVVNPEDVPGRPNVIGTWVGPAAVPSLILNDHLDTYPAGDATRWTKTNGKPYEPTREGDFLYARGTSDTRANLACTLLAVRALKEAGYELLGTLKCVYTVDEEKDGTHGSIYLLDQYGLTADYEITCEPTGWTRSDGSWGMDIATSNSGHFLVEVVIDGEQMHLWRPDLGVNPAELLPTILPALGAIEFSFDAPKTFGGTPPRTTVLRVRAGEPREMQFTPRECRLVLGLVGLVPGMTEQGVMADIEKTLDQLRATIPGLVISARPYPGALFVSATQEQDDAAEPSASLRDAYQFVLGDTPRAYRKNAFNDTIRFSERGIPAITFGPGEDGWPPINEYIRIEKSLAATRILALTLARILGVARRADAV